MSPGFPNRGSLERAGSILRQTHPDLIISKRTLERVRGIELVRIKREQANQALCFCSRPFVLCGLPVRRLPPGQLVYQRRNGPFILHVTGHPNYGVPFGQDRIVPIFLATLAVQQKSPIVRFRGAGEMLEIFGLHRGGKEYRRLVAAFERIFGATIFFGTDQNRAAAKVQRSRFNFLREAQIWYNREPDQPVLSEEFGNVIVLSDEFYREISEHPIPTDLEAVRVLSGGETQSRALSRRFLVSVEPAGERRSRIFKITNCDLEARPTSEVSALWVHRTGHRNAFVRAPKPARD